MQRFAVQSITTIVLITIISVGTMARAQTTQLPRYEIGSIPDQTVWHDGMSQFIVHWDEASVVNFSVTSAPEPIGELTIEPNRGSDWLFKYVPDAADERYFSVTITASSGGRQVSQSFVMTPQPYLPAEQSVFGTDKHTQPAAVTTYGISVFDRESVLAEPLNYENRKTRKIRIIGETIELEDGHANGLYAAYGTGDRRDIKELEIIAEKLIIRSPVHLKQTNVTIFARELRFEGDGRIQTTPEEKTKSPGVKSNGEGADGVDGLKAGDVTLNIGSFFAETTGSKFDLTGGRGQPGGPGRHGNNGASFSTYWSSVEVCDSGSCSTYTAPSGYYVVYWYYTFAGITAKSGGTESGWPGNGTDAKASGKPGEGGAGGMLTTNLDLVGSFSNYGAASGAASYPQTNPTNYYKGGNAGWPQYAKKVHFYWFQKYVVWGEVRKEESGSNVSTAGKNADVRQPNTAKGSDGGYALAVAPYAWVHPLLLRKILNHAKDDYLGNRIAEAEMPLQDYEDILADFMDDADWSNLDETVQYELEQIFDEIQILLQRIENGLDYYENPAGWVPLLSFEVNTTIFDNEIDRAITMLYLSYWIKNKADSEQQRVDALLATRDQLRTEIEQAKGDYDAAVARLPLLKNKAINLGTQIKETQLELQVKENELLQETGDPPWLTGLRLGLKVSAMMCQMVPVYQPALGAIGGGLRLASDIDPDKPWDTIIGAADLTSTYLASDFESSANDQQENKDDLDPDQVESKKFDYLGALRTAGTGLSAGLSDIRKFLAEKEAPSAEMLAELERLKSRSPEFKKLLEKVEALMAEQVLFAAELISTMQQIARLSDLMTRNILAIDAMSLQIAAGSIVLDERATSYLEDMERRAYDRLIKYHYYMAKAYEYRLLAPYTEPLDLKGLIQKFQEIADLNSDHQITPAQFEAFKAVYQEKIALVAETIFDQYNSNPPDLSVPIRFSLTPEEIARLNNGETVSLNLVKQGFFFPHEENIRIVDLKISSIATESTAGNYGSTAFVDVKIEHPGISNLKSDGVIYQFRHYNNKTQNPIVWGGRYDPIDDRIDPIKPSEASNSLLRFLLSGDAVSDMLLYSRPSVWTDLKISRSVFDNSGRGIDIKSLRLEMEFDFTPRKSALGLNDLEVIVTTATPAGSGTSNLTESSFRPYFIVDRPDFNGRQDARGRFLRIYEASQNPIRIEAPQTYGTWQFHKWTTYFGADLPGGPHLNPSIVLTSQDDRIISAQYIPESKSADLDGNGNTDGKDLHAFMDLWLSESQDADLNDDGRVNAADVGAFSKQFGKNM